MFATVRDAVAANVTEVVAAIASALSVYLLTVIRKITGHIDESVNNVGPGEPTLKEQVTALGRDLLAVKNLVLSVGGEMANDVSEMRKELAVVGDRIGAVETDLKVLKAAVAKDSPTARKRTTPKAIPK